MTAPDGTLQISVVVPTYNERENLRELAERVFSALAAAGLSGELVIVDDNSPDGTADEAEKLGSGYPLQVLVRKGRRGLSSAVLEGVELARAPVVCVMDADLSHPPEIVPKLYSAVSDGASIAVGSRLVEGGGVENWTAVRKLVSKGATILARPITPVRDPMSGFFCFRKEIIAGAPLEPTGYKILLEILAKARVGRPVEVPYIFRDRRKGTSKLSPNVMREFVSHILRLYGRRAAM